MPTPARPRGRGRRVSVVQALALLLSFCLVAGLGGLLTAGLALPGLAVANGVTDLTVTAFDDLPSELEQRPLPEKSEILAADGTLLATFYDQNRVVVPLSEIAPIMQKAVIAVEDRRFYEHKGIDPAGMLRAAVASAAGDTQGASTLTQQYVKNVFLDAAERADSDVDKARLRAEAKVATGPEGVARKLREAKIAITLEKTMTKDEILEKYLNIAAFGASVYGVESASRYFFSKSAKDLTYIEAATIAGITQSPSRWDPVGPADETPEQDAVRYERSQGRRDKVLKDMARDGYITPAELEAGLATPIQDTLRVAPLQQGCMTAGAAVPGSGFFCDYVTKVIANDPAFGETRKDRQNLLYEGGLTITTTLQPAEQAIADAEVKAGIPVDDPSGVGSAIATVEPGTGKITSMAQNREYSLRKDQGPNSTSVNWNTSGAYGGANGFPAGSTFKPFTLVEWLETGHSLTQTFDGRLRGFRENEFRACNAPYPSRKTWNPGNAEGAGGVMDAMQATRESVNSAYLAMAVQLDLCNIMQTAADLGVLDASENESKNINATPSNVIGSGSVTPLAMAGAFAAFAANGTYCKPIAITSVVNSRGEQLPVPDAGCHQAIAPQIANATTYALSNVWNGTARAVGAPSGFASAGKTGTTSKNEYTWFVGYTALRASAVWVGHPDKMESMKGKVIAGKRNPSGVYGSTYAAPTWKRFMVRAMEGLNDPGFASVGEKELYGDRVSVPSVLGQSEAQARATLEGAGFRVNVSGEQVQSGYPAGTVAQQSATRAPRGSSVTITISSGQPAGPPAPPGGDPGRPDPGNRGGGNPNPPGGPPNG